MWRRTADQHCVIEDPTEVVVGLKGQRRVDCGIFVMKCMEIWKPFLDMRRLFSHEDILNIRIQYAIKLFFHSENEADLRLVTDFYGKRISKDIVKALNIAKSGWVILGMGEYDNFQDAEYRTTTDGRMRFKSGWKKFVKDYDFEGWACCSDPVPHGSRGLCEGLV